MSCAINSMTKINVMAVLCNKCAWAPSRLTLQYITYTMSPETIIKKAWAIYQRFGILSDIVGRDEFCRSLVFSNRPKLTKMPLYEPSASSGPASLHTNDYEEFVLHFFCDYYALMPANRLYSWQSLKIMPNLLKMPILHNAIIHLQDSALLSF